MMKAISTLLSSLKRAVKENPTVGKYCPPLPYHNQRHLQVLSKKLEIKAKPCNLSPGRKNVQPLPSAGKLATGAKRVKMCDWCQARENMSPMPNARKRATGAKRGKTYDRCQARENVSLMPSARKRVTDAKRGKTFD